MNANQPNVRRVIVFLWKTPAGDETIAGHTRPDPLPHAEMLMALDRAEYQALLPAAQEAADRGQTEIRAVEFLRPVVKEVFAPDAALTEQPEPSLSARPYVFSKLIVYERRGELIRHFIEHEAGAQWPVPLFSADDARHHTYRGQLQAEATRCREPIVAIEFSKMLVLARLRPRPVAPELLARRIMVGGPREGIHN